MAGIPLDPDAFPHQAGIYPSSYARSPGGGPSRGDAAPVAVPCNGQLAGNDRLEAVPRGQGEAIGSRITYDLTLPGDGATSPQRAAILGVKAGDRVDLTAAGRTLALVALAPAAAVFGGSWWRLRCAIEA